MQKIDKKKILEIIQNIEFWFRKNNYLGYDIYDLYDTDIFHKILTNKPLLIRKINRKILTWIIFFFPNLTIKIFKKKPNINPKAMGLILKGYCNLYEITADHKYLDKAIYVADWLLKNRSTGIRGYGWGYPFNWSATKLISKGTPSSVVSAIVGDGFYSLFKITKDKKYLKICDKICKFFIYDLNIDYINKQSISFSYTPIDNNHVINANLFVAEFLLRIGFLSHNNEYISFGNKVLNYVLTQQKPNGDFNYWGKEDRKRLRFSFSNSDHYHTGFELRMLFKIWQITNNEFVKDSLKKYYSFYVNNFINNNYSINLFPNKKYPINIHACSEAILCNITLRDYFVFERNDVNKIFKWIHKTMIDTDGLYIYEIRRILGVKVKNRFKFHRWGQAWMFLALTTLLAKEREKS